jgi:hypothetical protein
MFFTYSYLVYNDVPMNLTYWFYYVVVCIIVMILGFLEDELCVMLV